MLFFFLKILFVVSIINIIIKVKIIKVIIIFAIIIIINHHHKLFSYSFNCCYYYWQIIFSSRKRCEEFIEVRVDNKYFSPLKQHSIVYHLSYQLYKNISINIDLPSVMFMSVNIGCKIKLVSSNTCSNIQVVT